jgi:enoyl-CoA hydratase/carnithine racemase
MTSDAATGLRTERRGSVLVVMLARPEKRNALSDRMISGLEELFRCLDADVNVVVIAGEGDHFSAGLDLAEMKDRDALDGVLHSRTWHRCFTTIEQSGVPVVAALHGAVVGGGLELAATAHIRVADETTFYALPEGQRGLFVGGGGSVRVSRLTGTARMVDMMLTGRRYGARDGERIGLSQYVVEPGESLDTALSLAGRIADNAPQTNFAVTQVLPIVPEIGPQQGLVMESLMAAIAQSTPDAKARMDAFLSGRAKKVTDD